MLSSLCSVFLCYSVWPCVTPETAAHQVPLSLGFARQECWSGLPFPSPKSIATLALFWFLFSWNIFSHPFTFSPCVSLDLKWVSCRQHRYGFYFCVCSVILCLLIGAFSLFSFKVCLFALCVFAIPLNCLLWLLMLLLLLSFNLPTSFVFINSWFINFNVYLPLLMSFLFLMVAFPFLLREVPLTFLVKICLVVLSSFNFHCCWLVAKSCPTLCDPMNCGMPGFLVLHCLLEFAQIHVHWIGDAI